MNKKTTRAYLLSLTIIFFGCKHSSDTHSGDTMQQEEQHLSTSIQLNDGEKWKANDETIEGIKIMQNLIDKFPSNPTPEDYRLLKTNFEDNLKVIFDKCTMTGEAHEQLHNFLLPLINMTEFLGSKDIEICKTTFVEITQHIAGFDTYFE